MASYGFEIGPGLAPWWQGSTNQFMGRQGALGREPSELDVRKVLDAISKQRDFSNMGGGMLTVPTPVGQPVPIASTPMQPSVQPSVQPVASNSAPQVTQMDSNMGAPMTSSVMPSTQPMTPSVMPSMQPMTPSVCLWRNPQHLCRKQIC